MTARPASEPPSERQLAYARGVGITVPPDATAAEVSDLLTTYQREGQPATPELQAAASRWGVPFTRFTCLEELYDRITRTLTEPGRGADLATWFAFNVARDIHAAVTGATDPALSEIADRLAADEHVMRSVRRKDQGCWLRFGEWTGDDGVTTWGASRDTGSYKAAAALIRERFGIVPPAPRQKPARKPAEPAAAQGAGCLSAVVGVALVIGFALAGIAGAVHSLAG